MFKLSTKAASGLLLVAMLAGCKPTAPSVTAPAATIAAQPPAGDLEYDAVNTPDGIVLRGVEKLSTPERFEPPVEIKIIAKTDSTNLRLVYAADQVIFNWEDNREQLRVDGGPAGGQHRTGMGNLPTNEYVNIRWLVTPQRQALYVNEKLRFEHAGDYSHIDRPVSVFPAQGSVVTVKSLKVKRLSPGR
ncbi:MAG: hypothetical protein K0Q55_3638 [Verrucomicrobia bacterium]|nr:hypothetical protein [Verrucomicrobiota bacterium]